ncbi:substrate-binding domain-containing protein, partial [Pleurocapsa sp. CCALA 161]|uniref:substrate-binding domain-containing protein n=1 Tax=Pleurocapsa sp. CCALA 161 TaxID=2107688 RepID=UPI001E5D5D45
MVGVSKPAKAYLLAQSDSAAKTFAVPDKLPQDATVKIAASSSINGISASLKDSFASKYPQAKVQINTQDSVTALKTLANGQADLAAIGRALTAAEKAQGFVSVPISREKIALVVSKNNPFDGNITIDQFAKIFRGEITDWSEIGGTSGKIQLIDAPNSNDTRQAFPNYPVFQTGEFKTGSTANQLKQDSVDAMIAKLGKNGIGYAVANDVIKRGDVKVISMHQTQPDDPRYPFSEPFNLIYKGTPSKAAQAYLGFATSQGGKQVIANRVGSISAAAATAMASKTASSSAKAGIDGTKDSAIAVGKNTPNTAVNGKKTASAGNAQTATVPGKNTLQNESGQGIIASADASGSGKANPDVQSSGQVNPNVNGSGEINPDVQSSGQVNPNVQGSGEVNPNVNGSGEVNPNVNGSGEINPDVQGSGEPLSAINDTDGVNADQAAVAPVAQADANPGTKVAEKKGTWWWWLLPLLGIPLLALAIWGGRKKSDQEPALNDIPNINSLDGRNSPPGSPDGGESVPLGANRPGGGLGNVAENTGNNVSNLGAAGLAAGGAALAGGAAANLAGRRNRIENVADADLDLDESTTVEEIPSNPVSEFTGQETKLQVSDQPTNLQLDGDDGEFTGQKTKLQVSDQPTNLQLDEDDELELNDNQPIDNISLGGAAAIGGAAAVSSDSTELNLDNTAETATTDATAGREFPGDFVLEEESRSISVPDEVATDIDPHRTDVTDVTRGDIDTDVEVAEFSQDNDFNLDDRTDNINTSVAFPDSVEDVTARGVDLSTDTDVDPNVDRPGIIDGITQTGGAAIAGGAAAAASGMFNREDRTREDTDVDAAEFNQDTDLNLGEGAEDFEPSATYIDTTDIDAPEFNQDTDLNLGEGAEDFEPSATYIDITDVDAPE